MRKRIILQISLVLSAVFVTQSLYAQSNFSIGIKGGISIPDLKSSGNNPVSSGWSSRLGPYVGVVGELTLSDKLSLQGELNYASQGGKKDGLQVIPTASFSEYFPPGLPVPPYLYADYKTEAKLYYLELPLLLKFRFPINENISFFVGAGPYGGYLLDAKNVSTGMGNIYLDEKLTQPLLTGAISFDSTVDIRDDLKKYNFGVQAGVGFSLNITPSSKILLTGGGNYGLMSIQKDETNGKNSTGAATITLAYLVDL